MEYFIKGIRGKEEIKEGMRFSVNCFQWKNKMKTKTYGYLGYVEGKGFYALVQCEEKNPKRECVEYQHNVCLDSVIEIFLAFPQKEGVPKEDDMYINYEMNANGMLYGKYGKGRKDRKFISDTIYEKSDCRVEIKPEFWELTVWIPEELLKEIGVYETFVKRGTCYCNFYKMSECEEIEHYGMFSLIESKEPNFHLPKYFAKATYKRV